MPELPEVENLRQGLSKAIVGQKIHNIKINKPKLVSGNGTRRPASKKKAKLFIESLTGEKFISVERRAKNLIFNLSHGKIILTHLKMSGQFVYQDKIKNKKIVGGHPIELSETILPNKHTHIIFKLDRGTLYYNDTRMFGYVLYYPNKETVLKEKHFNTYGAEPLSKEFTLEYFSNSLKNKRGKIKPVLMDQKIVTGVGNIYTDEALFETCIHPERQASSLSKTEVKNLYKAIIRILKRATKLGGSSVATYRLLDATKGNYAREHKVYGKEGERCKKKNCRGVIERKLINGRSTHFCRTHQV